MNPYKVKCFWKRFRVRPLLYSLESYYISESKEFLNVKELVYCNTHLNLERALFIQQDLAYFWQLTPSVCSTSSSDSLEALARGPSLRPGRCHHISPASLRPHSRQLQPPKGAFTFSMAEQFDQTPWSPGVRLIK